MRDPRAFIRNLSLGQGFDAVGFAPAGSTKAVQDGLKEFLASGYHGDMGWMADRAAERADPVTLWPDARSAIVLGLSYAPQTDPMETLALKDHATISVYAQGLDYHDVIKKRLKAVAREIVAKLGGDVKVFVDTAPLMEKPLAQKAGIGWQGKHTNLVSREHGSWLFLGVILTTHELEPDGPEADHCGTCSRCLDACPTQAFPAPYRLDARRCISYLTIEHKGPIARDLRPLMGNRIYGCDDCLSVCPWNKFAAPTQEQAFLPREGKAQPRLADLAGLDDAAFRARFAKSPVKRIGRDRFVRNVLIAIGNSGDTSLVPAAEALFRDTSPLVRGAAIWALGRLLTPAKFETLRAQELPAEPDGTVREEWGAV